MKKRLRLRRAGKAVASAALILLLTRAAYAQEHIDADRPGIADASTVVKPRSLQLETGGQWESRPADRVWFLPTLFRIGLLDRLEARIESNTWTAETNRGQQEYGIAPISIGAALVLHPGYGVIARVFPAWGSSDFRASRVTGDLRLAMDFELPRALSLNPNVGVASYETEGGRFFTGLMALTLSYEPTPKLEWFVDTGVQTPEDEQGSSSVIVDGGAAIFLGRNAQLDVSAGTGIHGNTPPHPFVSVGFALRKR
jgi:Putative MetA-pathway of phenol degradation